MTRNKPVDWFWIAMTIAGLFLIAIALADVLFYRASATTQEAQDYGQDFFIDGAPADGKYVLTGVKRNQIPVPVTYYPQGAPVNGSVSAIQSGTVEWSTVTANFQFSFVTSAGLPMTSLCGPSNSGLPSGIDGINSVVWANLSGPIGVACWNTAFDECDIALDAGWGSTASAEAIRTVQLHEAGHCAGLGHSAVPGAVMYYLYTVPKNLHADDRAGICAVYGCAPVPTATSTPTATPTSTPVPTLPFRKFIPGIARD